MPALWRGIGALPSDDRLVIAYAASTGQREVWHASQLTAVMRSDPTRMPATHWAPWIGDPA